MRNPIAVLAVLAALISPTAARACDEMGELRQAMQQAKAASAAAQRENLSRAVAEAQLVKDIMEETMYLVYFPGMWQLREEAINLPVGASDAWRAVSERLAFLRGKPGSVVELKAADRAAQFAALKAEYRACLERAGNAQRALGESRQDVWALAEWGVESIVSTDGKDYDQILTHAQKGRIVAPAPPALADPHE